MANFPCASTSNLPSSAHLFSHCTYLYNVLMHILQIYLYVYSSVYVFPTREWALKDSEPFLFCSLIHSWDLEQCLAQCKCFKEWIYIYVGWKWMVLTGSPISVGSLAPPQLVGLPSSSEKRSNGSAGHIGRENKAEQGQKNENTSHRLRENLCKSHSWQRTGIQNIQKLLKLNHKKTNNRQNILRY